MFLLMKCYFFNIFLSNYSVIPALPSTLFFSNLFNKRLPGSLHHHVTTHTAYSQTRFCAFRKRTKKVNNSRYQHFQGQSQSRCAAALRRKREALPVGQILDRPAD